MCSMSTRKPVKQPVKKPVKQPERTRYRGARIAVGTRHGKEQQFAPAFSAVLGAQLSTPPDLDTDRFGTFTGERPRVGPALEAARAKARLAMDVTGLPLGLASEASYGPLPGLGWPGHEEILLFCDDVLGIEVVEGHRGAAGPTASVALSPGDDLPAPLLAGLPGQALIVRPAEPGSGPTGIEAGIAQGIMKGITDTAALHAAIVAAADISGDGRAIVEPDLRAHHNPQRRRVLVTLARRLALRLATECPACAAPGFGRVDSDSGLPCRLCGTPTPAPQAEIHGCGACGHSVHRPVVGADADPAHCPSCNP